jgi:hypothetical protein
MIMILVTLEYQAFVGPTILPFVLLQFPNSSINILVNYLITSLIKSLELLILLESHDLH